MSLYGGTGQKGAGADPRYGRARRPGMPGRGGRRVRWGWIVAGAIVGIAVAVLVVLTNRADSGPEIPAETVGQLSCPEGSLREEPILGEGRNPREMLMQIEESVVGVVADQAVPGRWWGFDSDGGVVARLAETSVLDEYVAHWCAG